MFFLLTFFAHSWGRRQEFNMYEFVPGNWTQRTEMNITIPYSMEFFETSVNDEGVNVSTFKGSFNETSVTISVDSNSSVWVEYGDFPKFNVNFTRLGGGVGIFDGVISNGVYLTATIFNPLSVEFSVVLPGDETIHTFGFYKRIYTQTTATELIVTIGLAVVITIFIKKYLGPMLGM
ncbi:hypothetical protein TRFO_06459 [Tritrichomonas foetus]|uniref:Uncharacterized protein n=1 Tax=Tritrichomonas foetus TaxID=1144522 RepID=A0A1J4K321_9EUKA|nr:hypothetical protein TRFO_06459 [Tritrichomonas foetus]|eukprot:OHT04140.1 hypothetical protein TRFO_06459 [Tritrichomonas foetus]